MKTTDLTRQVWLLLLRRGGWWTREELIEALHLEDSPDLRRALLFSVRNMTATGVIVARPNEVANCMQYGVTGTCLILKGMTVGEVQL